MSHVSYTCAPGTYPMHHPHDLAPRTCPVHSFLPQLSTPFSSRLVRLTHARPPCMIYKHSLTSTSLTSVLMGRSEGMRGRRLCRCRTRTIASQADGRQARRGQAEEQKQENMDGQDQVQGQATQQQCRTGLPAHLEQPDQSGLSEHAPIPPACAHLQLLYQALATVNQAFSPPTKAICHPITLKQHAPAAPASGTYTCQPGIFAPISPFGTPLHTPLPRNHHAPAAPASGTALVTQTILPTPSSTPPITPPTLSQHSHLQLLRQELAALLFVPLRIRAQAQVGGDGIQRLGVPGAE